MMRFSGVSIGMVLAGFAATTSAAGLTAVGKEKDEPAAKGDLVCGPRCAAYILHHFGKDADLIDLARDIQWPDLEQGASLDKVNAALQSRGVHTFAMAIPADAVLRWDEPVLVHMRGESDASGEHFVVWLPNSSAGQVEYWNGLRGIEASTESDFRRRRSGAILLTSAAPIVSPGDAVRKAEIVAPWVIWLGVALGGGAAFAVVCWRRRMFLRPPVVS